MTRPVESPVLHDPLWRMAVATGRAGALICLAYFAYTLLQVAS